jgi:hypothetical protein
MTPPAAAVRSRAAAAPVPAPLRQPFAPRRVSGPARHARALPQPRRARGPIGRLLDAPVLDRLIRGRIWIALIAFALLGIVAMQVAILQLGASIGHSVSEIASLQQANEAAETRLAQAEPGRNVASEAASLGMVYPPAGNVVYLRYSAGDAARAAGSLTLPTAPLFTPAAAILTAPIDPLSSAASTGPVPATPGATGTQATNGATGATPTGSGGAATTPAGTAATTTTTAATTTPPASTQAGGAVSGAPPAASGATDLGSGGGSAAPSG